jgi:hypothetical protein
MTTRKQSILSAIGALPLLFATAIAADDRHDNEEKVKANLAGYHEVPLTLFSGGTATFRARIANDDQSFDWTLTYSGLTGVTQSHIHFGAPALNGGIVVFLCTNLGNAPPFPAAPVAGCNPSADSLSGTARAVDVTGGAAPQGIAAREFAKVIAAIRAGATYANIHTVARPGGEIRGPIHSHSDH